MRSGAMDAGGSEAGGLVALARGLLLDGSGWLPDHGPAGGAAGARAAAGPGVVLSLSDILTDDGGACVLAGGGIDLSVLLETDDPVVAQGQSEPRATAAGEDVSGHAFIAFASGVTVYFPAEIEVAIAAPGG